MYREDGMVQEEGKKKTESCTSETQFQSHSNQTKLQQKSKHLKGESFTSGVILPNPQRTINLSSKTPQIVYSHRGLSVVRTILASTRVVPHPASMRRLVPRCIRTRVQQRSYQQRAQHDPAHPRKREHRSQHAACLELRAERRQVRPYMLFCLSSSSGVDEGRVA